MRKCLRNTVFMAVRIYWLKDRSMCGDWFLPTKTQHIEVSGAS